MTSKIHVITMKNDEMDPMEIGYASTEEIAKQMIETVSHTDGFEYNEYETYPVNLDSIGLNTKMFFFNKVLQKPLTMEEIIESITKDSTYVQGNVLVDTDEMIENDGSEFIDLIVERFVGDIGLCDINYKAIGVTENNQIILQVSGDVFDSLLENLQRALFDAGADAIKDFIDAELEFDTDEDMMEAIEDTADQMPIEEFMKFYKKYVSN